MNGMIEITIFSIVEVLALIFAAFYSEKSETFSNEVRRNFKCLAIVIAVNIILDVTSFWIEISQNKHLINLHFLIKTLELINVPLMPIIGMNLVKNEKRLNKLKMVGYILFSINVCIMILNYFTPIICYIDQYNIYKRASFFMLSPIIGILCNFIFVHCLFFYAQRTQNNNNIVSLILIVFFIIIGYVLRIFFIRINVDWLAATLAFFMYVIFYSDIYLKLDTVTGVLNRRAFEYAESNIDYTTAFIVIDANNFKTINDTKGHLYGDAVLKVIATSLTKSFKGIAKVYRIGGDEFCIILNRNVLINESLQFEGDTEKCLTQLMNKAQEDLSNYYDKYPLLSDGISYGCSVYYKRNDITHDSIKGENYSVVETINIADNRMYKNKKKYKKKKEKNKI